MKLGKGAVRGVRVESSVGWIRYHPREALVSNLREGVLDAPAAHLSVGMVRLQSAQIERQIVAACVEKERVAGREVSSELMPAFPWSAAIGMPEEVFGGKNKGGRLSGERVDIDAVEPAARRLEIVR